MSTTAQRAVFEAASNALAAERSAATCTGAREFAQLASNYDPSEEHYIALAESIDREVHALHRKVGALRELAAKARAATFAKA